ncbi:TlpA family protein disulfide reductase [Ectothiorhodospiraceae bacterium 2226]|nr:TlpA family protein disulfide reductase [Ectothiorhodospiraceae bacterium 2226]
MSRAVRRWLLSIALVLPMAALASAELVLPGMDGREHKVSDYRGNWVVVNFWATWCPPCLKEIPELIRFHERRDDAVVLGVNMEDIDADMLAGFIDVHAISYPVLRMEPASQTPLGPVVGLPTTYLVDPSGEVVARHLGELDAQMLDEFIDKHESRGR